MEVSALGGGAPYYTSVSPCILQYSDHLAELGMNAALFSVIVENLGSYPCDVTAYFKIEVILVENSTLLTESKVLKHTALAPVTVSAGAGRTVGGTHSGMDLDSYSPAEGYSVVSFRLSAWVLDCANAKHTIGTSVYFP